MLRNNVFRLLKEQGHRVIIVSPFGKDEQFREEFGGAQIIFEALVPIPRFFRRIINLRGEALKINHPKLNEAKEIHRHLTRRYRKNIDKENVSFAVRTLRIIPARIRNSETFWNKVEDVIFHIKSYTRIFNYYKPDVIITASAGAEAEDVPFIVYGNRYHIPIFAIDNNIDVFTFRYFSRVRPGVNFALFNEDQKQEALTIQGVPEDRLYVTGAARYDFMMSEFKPLPRDVFFRSINRNPQKKLITYGAKIPIIYPQNQDIMELITKMIIETPDIPAELFVRFDPGHDPLLYEQFLRQHDIAYERAEEASEREHIANLLYHSDVVVSIGSTFNIEAAFVGTPSIFIAFDGNRKYTDDKDSYQNVYKLDLFKRIEASGGIAYAYSERECLSELRRYLKNRDSDKEKREQMIRRINFQSDGKAGERIARLILGKNV